MVKFGDVVLDTKGKVDRANNPYDYYIAGDHMDTEDLEIHRKGCFATDDVGPAFVRTFKPGQVLYGSRRTYLKKVAVADFEGVTANTTFVFETKDSSILSQELLPFIMWSDKFTDFSILKSRGSTNPYVLFSDLAEYEFDLPDLAKQEQLAELLWSMEYTKRAYRKMITQTDELVKSQFIEMFGTPENNTHEYPVGMISDVVCDVHYGTSKKASDDGEYTYLRMNNITYGGELDLTDVKHISVPQKELDGCLVKKGDVLFNRTNSRELVGKTCAFMLDEPMIIAGYIIRLRMNGKACPEYLSTFLNLDSSKKMLMAMAKGAVGQANINAKEVQAIEIVIPPIEVQQQFCHLVHQSDKSKIELQKVLDELTAMQKKIIEQSLT